MDTDAWIIIVFRKTKLRITLHRSSIPYKFLDSTRMKYGIEQLCDGFISSICKMKCNKLFSSVLDVALF
jgi:hypothetical protein